MIKIRHSVLRAVLLAAVLLQYTQIAIASPSANDRSVGGMAIGDDERVAALHGDQAPIDQG